MADLRNYDPRLNASFGASILLSASGVLEQSLTTDEVADSGELWGRWDARRTRYRIQWGLYEQNIYARLQQLTEQIKDRFDLYDAVRSVYAPGYLIGEFFVDHLFPGGLDTDAGDGGEKSSSCPILTENEAVRPSLSLLWRDSRMAEQLESYSRYGAVFGDVFLRVVDDPWRARVYLQAVHPGTVREFDGDPAGNCRGYVIERQEPDPEHDDHTTEPPLVTYTEVAVRSGDSVIYRTYRDGEDYDWRAYGPGQPVVGSAWAEPYGFVPLVRVRHRLHAGGWGAGEYHFDVSKLMDLDCLASRLCDHVSWVVRSPWYFEGGKVKDIALAGSEGGEKAFPMLSGEGKPHSLMTPLDLRGSLDLMKELLAGIERDHPELMADRVGAGSSGEARKVAREKAESKVVRRRAAYDAGLVLAQKMALSIGGMGKYDGYQWVNPDSYESGELDHAIGPRPVFALGEDARLENEERRGKALQSLVAGGLPMTIAMRRCGFDEADIAAARAEASAAEARAEERARRLGFTDVGPADPGTEGNQPVTAPTDPVDA